MAKCISIINMKGGVGKSTLCTNLAWHFSAMSNWKKRVLVVDLDPQFNASQYMLGVAKYQKNVIDNDTPTVWDIFEQASRLPGLKSSGRDLKSAIIRNANFNSGQYLDIVPSQLGLSRTLKNPSQKEHLLANFIDDVKNEYDLILIDCAPTESVLTTAAYLSSDRVLVPVKPEFLSTIGLPLIKESLDDFTQYYRKSLDQTLVCYSMSTGYSPEEAKAKKDVNKVSHDYGWKVLNEQMPYSKSFPKGAREGSPIFRTSYARSTVAKEVSGFCNAFGKAIGL
ncbi:hypothetical protein LCGC14_0988190 [marine sediment metagenome]|uniref:AAA domain-containing protein n=1 Tax=marine sediment metagenome TaxID=412755 RepID=A0A0F9N6G3_9ZZZZ|tara:strand:- start:851 stop:1693 length:843 start_codon:yes stop_codon:yes gene_type:complete